MTEWSSLIGKVSDVIPTIILCFQGQLNCSEKTGPVTLKANQVVDDQLEGK